MNPPARLRLLELSAQTSDEVSALWNQGSVAIALRLSIDDFRRLFGQIADEFATSGQVLPVALVQLSAELADVDPPELDRDFTSAHRLWLLRLQRARRQCRGILVPPSKLNRFGWPAALGLLALALAVAFVVVPTRTRVRSSGAYANEFAAENVLDGFVATEWLLPDKQTGWIELQFAKPRSLSVVTLRNSHNRHHQDRGTKKFRVEAYAVDRQVGTAVGEFPPVGLDRPAKEFRLQAAGVTRLRIVVLSFYGSGGGLAEVEVD